MDVFQVFIIIFILKMNFLICTFQRFRGNFKYTIMIYQKIEEHLRNRTDLNGCFLLTLLFKM